VLRAQAHVDRAAIAHNAGVLRAALTPGTQLCAVVKADGYGHGMTTTARAALGAGASWLAVATAGEAEALRVDGIIEPRVLVMGALAPEELARAVAARADVVAWDLDFTATVPAGTRVHVKLDTGMGRLGTRSVEQATAVAEAAAATGQLAGLMTHFATADEPGAFFDEQLARFATWAPALKARVGGDVLVHAANSAATFRDPAAHFDLVRAGVALYGMDPANADPARHGLRPALRLTSRVAAVKPCAAGQSTGYGRRWVAERDTLLATVPIGYGDGWRRGLTNNGEAIVRGRRHPVVGAVSMDNLVLDLGAASDVRAGDEVVLIGDGLLAEEVAARLQTVNYEVTCGLTARVPRVVR
jgi:alanine racemase